MNTMGLISELITGLQQIIELWHKKYYSSLGKGSWAVADSASLANCHHRYMYYHLDLDWKCCNLA